VETYIFLGLSVAVSVLGFFLKRLKEEIDVLKAKNTKLEVSTAREFEKVRNLEKISEDRREDIKSLFSKLDK
jgi:Tfp pilus assembly protein PilO